MGESAGRVAAIVLSALGLCRPPSAKGRPWPVTLPTAKKGAPSVLSLLGSKAAGKAPMTVKILDVVKLEEAKYASISAKDFVMMKIMEMQKTAAEAGVKAAY